MTFTPENISYDTWGVIARSSEKTIFIPRSSIDHIESEGRNVVVFSTNGPMINIIFPYREDVDSVARKMARRIFGAEV